MKERAIGVFDSGLGGISVLNSCVNELPNESYIYFADKNNAPYGDKTTEEIIDLVDNVVKNIFVPKGVKAIVIACNTATNAAIDVIREKYKIPIIGTEPAIKPALLKCKDDKKVLVMATESTINSKKLKTKLSQYDKDRYIAIGCSGLVELIESNDFAGIKCCLNDLLNGINKQEIESVVLGCTHYPFVIENLKEVLGDDVEFIHGGEGVARRLKEILLKFDILSEKNKGLSVELFNSLNEEYNDKLRQYIGRK